MLVQFHQQIEESLGRGVGVVDGGEPLAQCGQQRGKQTGELVGVCAGQRGLGAPDEGVHHFEATARVGAAGLVCQARLRHDLGPRAEQEAGDGVRQGADTGVHPHVAR
ncbi:hypothetical protein D3C71_1663200 [compost metagenome]